MTKDATRLTLWVTGVAIMVAAVALWVAVISWGWGKCGRSSIILVMRCMYSVGFGAVAAACQYYAPEVSKRPPVGPWTMVVFVVGMTYLVTVLVVESSLRLYPDSLYSIRGILMYTAFWILIGSIAPVRYYAGRYYRRRKGTLSDDRPDEYIS